MRNSANKTSANALRFLVKDFLEYIRRLLVLEKNGTKLRFVENCAVKARAFEKQGVAGALEHRIEGVDRLVLLMDTLPANASSADVRDALLRLLMKAQMANQKFR